jgi:hypothetical protein
MSAWVWVPTVCQDAADDWAPTSFVILIVLVIDKSKKCYPCPDRTTISKVSNQQSSIPRVRQHTAGPYRIACRVKDPEHSRREQVERVGATIRDCRKSLSTYSF